MRFIYFLILSLTIYSISLFAQLETPTAEGVYGGRIKAMSVISTGANSSRLFISTESDNSIFYSDISSTPGSESFGTFTVMPGAGNDDGFGSGITNIAADKSSGYLFFIANGKLYSTLYSSSGVDSISVTGMVKNLMIYNSYLFFIEGANFRFGQIAPATGKFTEDVNSPYSISALVKPEISIDKTSGHIYIAELNSSPPVVKEFSDTYNSITSSTSLSTISTSSLSSSAIWTSFGIGPDETIFLGGTNSGIITVSYSTDKGSSWSTSSSGISGSTGENFGFSGSGSNYVVLFSKIYNSYVHSTGFGASWLEFGNVSFETHPNDGAVEVDPNNSSIYFMTTDQGIGASKNGGAEIFEIGNGVEAVQVNDFSLLPTKYAAWAASKSGMRKVTNLNTGSPSWSYSIFPNGDGSPYYSAEVVGYTGDTAYAGNVRVYKTTNGGTGWTQIFTPENAPFNFSSVNTRIQCIAVDPTDPGRIFVGVVVDDGSNDGGLFVTEDGGSTWEQILIQASSVGYDADVYDIAIVNEGGNEVAYAGVDYSSTARSIYRITKPGTTYIATQSMDASGTSVGYAISTRIYDLQASISGDTLLATGTDVGTNHPIAYYKIYSGTNKWTTFTTSGFPIVSGKVGKAITMGGDTVFVAVDNEIYMKTFSSAAWTLGYSYPVGTSINFLFYDDLLVGTGTGLYNQKSSGTLPVELSAFSAIINNDKVSLNWRTATEKNNFGFEIQRISSTIKISKADFQKTNTWQKIGFTQGAGNSNSDKKYSFIDPKPVSGNLYYRLKQIDHDGSFKYSKIIHVSYSAEKPDNFRLYQNFPNPFNPTTTIKYEVADKSLISLILYNSLGQKIKTLVEEVKEAGKYSIQINASDLSSGIYYVKMSANNFIAVKKIVLLK